jgi:hypothetical protein
MFSVLGGSAGNTCFFKVGYLNSSCYLAVGQSGEVNTQGQIHAGSSIDSVGAITAGTYATAKAGSSTGVFKASGIVCDTIAGSCSCTTMTDAATQNQWNVITCTLPASALATNGDEIEGVIEFNAAANANTKEFQAYWNGGTCSGTGATMCSTGTSLWGAGVTTTTNANSVRARFRVIRSSSGNQDLISTLAASTAILGQGATTATVTDTNTIAISFGGRNTSAAAATFGTPTAKMRIIFYGV